MPIFQEQILRVAMVAAGFSGGQAEELRRAMGFKRSVDRMKSIEERLRAGMTERGIAGAAQEQIVHAITSFALYGFPESHAASFALIAYASAYLKAHHPTAFCLALLNAWPMGFYHPATLIKDAQRHGVEVRPIDVQRSGWRCRWEEREQAGGERRRRRRDRAARRQGAGARHGGGGGRPPGAIRLGLRFVRGLRQAAAEAIEREQAAAPFAGPDDLARRCRLRDDELATLAAWGRSPASASTRAGRPLAGGPRRPARRAAARRASPTRPPRRSPR